jgi:predicted RNA binding protein YcfA (HicA-like mRNA interferase family)
MSKLPLISGKECVRNLEKTGFYFKRQEGSHIVIPDHKKLDRGTLRAIIRQAGLNVDDFVNLSK